MSKKVKPIPDGYHTLTPFLSLKEAAKAIQFYKEAFGAKELEKHLSPDGKVMHAVIQIGDSLIMMADEFPGENGCGMVSPKTLNGTSVLMHLYVEDADAVFNKAVKAGAKEKMP